MPKVIKQISVGPIGDKVGWVLHYEGGAEESFSLHLTTARQFMQGLQELVLLLEHQAAQATQGTQDPMGLSDQVTVRLSEPHEG